MIMKEEWKLVKRFDKVYNYLYLPNDEIWISNKGNVRLNDILLSFDFGLYIGKWEAQHDINIYGFSWPELKIYRTIYTLFKEEIKPKYNIHHVDGNHLNNNIDNLVQVSFKEHRRLHANLDSNIESEVDKLKLKKEESISKYYNYLIERYNKYKLEIKQQEIEEKLRSGLYQLNKNGKLCRTTTAKKGYVTPIEVRKKQSESITKKYKEDKEYHQRIVDANNRNKDKMRKTLSNTRKGSKMVINSDGTKTWIYQN